MHLKHNKMLLDPKNKSKAVAIIITLVSDQVKH